MRTIAACLLTAALTLAPAHALARQGLSIEASPGVRALLDAPHLTDEERRELRVFHGLFTRADLQDTRMRAKAALTLGVYDDPSLSDEAADALDRAQAALRRGEAELAIELAGGDPSARAARIRAESLETLGRFTEARRAVEQLAERFTPESARDTREAVEAVRALNIRARITGQPARDFQRMIQQLGRVRTELDRMFWPAFVAEGRILYEKDTRGPAGEALVEALTLNPASADAAFLLGQLGVDSFNFDGALQIASQLDEQTSRITGDAESRSPLAALVRARAWLRQNEPDLAEEEIAPLLERFPKMRELLALRVAIAAVRYDPKETERLLEEFDALSPGSPVALHAAGAALAANRQYDLAAPYLQRAIERQPNWPPPLVDLGLLDIQAGRDERAREVLARAVELDPFNRRAVNSLTLVTDLQQFDEIESDHFIVRHQPGVDGLVAQEMVPVLAQIHEIVAGAIDHEPDRKTIVELMPDHQWFAVRITGMPAVHTIAAATGPLIAMEAPRTGAGHSGVYDWERVVRHEYVHTVTLSRTNNRIPHWFTEAAAVHLELSPRDFDTVRLLVGALRRGELFDLRKINIAFVRPERPTDRAQAYAQGHWMYEFIIDRWGERAPLDLMDLYAQGVREPEAMRQVLGISQEEFFESFVEWATRQAAGWGMLPEPPLRELMLDATIEAHPDRPAVTLRTFGTGFALASIGLAPGTTPPMRLTEATIPMTDAWLADHPEHPDVLQLRIALERVANNGRDTEPMIPLLERYSQARPVDSDPHRALASLYLASEDPSRAIPHLEHLDARETRSASYAIELARRYALVGDLESARAKAERATRIAPYDADHRELAATIALMDEARDVAERHLRALIALEPDREIHRRRLDALLAHGAAPSES